MANVSIPGYANIAEYKEGGSAHILRAVRKSDRRPVAIKMAKPEVVADKAQLKAFRQEAEIMAALRCRSIVRVLEMLPDATPRPAFAMELFPSDNLKQILYETPEIAQKFWYPILWETAGALMYIHDRGIVHRDVKPENVLVAKSGTTKLCDFSLAVTKRIKPKTIQGTTTYIAPEQIQRKKLDARTDIYSFGVTIYELLAGQPPFTGPTPKAILDQHLTEPPKPLRRIVESVDAGLEEVVLRMLAKNVKERPQSMREVLDVLVAIRSRVAPPPPPPRAEVRPSQPRTAVFRTPVPGAVATPDALPAPTAAPDAIPASTATRDADD